MLDRYPDQMADLEEGLIVVLDYQEPLETSDLIGRTVEIQKPDHEIVRHRIAHAKIRGVALGLLFAKLKRADVPVGSDVSLDLKT